MRTAENGWHRSPLHSRPCHLPPAALSVRLNLSGPPARSSAARHAPAGDCAVSEPDPAKTATASGAARRFTLHPWVIGGLATVHGWPKGPGSSPPPPYRSPASTGAGMLFPRHGAGHG